MIKAVEQQLDIVHQPNVAFGRFVKPETHDVFGEYDLATVSEEEQRWMTAQRLTGILFDRGPRFGLGIVDGVRVNTEEYGLVARHPNWIANTVISRVLGDREVDDARIEKAQTRAAESLERKSEKMYDYVRGLELKRDNIGDLAREARTPGFAHKKEERMTELFGTALGEFNNMLNVAHVQREWNDETRFRAHTTLLHYLTSGSQRTRVQNWQAMLSLSDRYLDARIYLFRNRIRRTGEFLTSMSLAA